MVKRIDRAPVVDSFHTKEIHGAVKKGRSFIEDLTNVATSKPLLFTLQATVQGLPTSLDVPKLNSWYQKITSRISYLEAAVLSAISTVFNCIMSIGAACFTLATLGQIEAFKSAVRKYASYAGLAGICTAISAVGVFSPKGALLFGGVSGAAIGAFLTEELKGVGKDVEKIGFIPLVQFMYEKFYPQIESLVYENIGNKSEGEKILKHLDKAMRELDVYWDGLKNQLEKSK